jgi:hypothetical protein
MTPDGAALTAPQFRYTFGNEFTEEASDALHEKRVIPATAGRCCLMMGDKDHTVPESITRATVEQYRNSPATTELVEFPDRGHSFTIDSGWREIPRRRWPASGSRDCERDAELPTRDSRTAS